MTGRPASPARLFDLSGGAAAVYLASRAGGFSTGSALTVDGGLTAMRNMGPFFSRGMR